MVSKVRDCPGRQADDAVDDRRDHQLPVQLELAFLAILPGEHLVSAAHHQGAADHVAGLGCAVDVDHLRVPAARLLDRLVDAFLGDLGALHRNAKGQVLAQVHLGLHGHGRRELERLVALELAEIEFRVTDGLHAGLVDGATVEFGDEVVDGLVPDGLPADGTLHHRGRRLARTESGDPDAPGEAAQRSLDGCLHLVRSCLNLEGNLRGGLALERDGHWTWALLWSVGHLGTHVSGWAMRGPRLRTRTGRPTGS